MRRYTIPFLLTAIWALTFILAHPEPNLSLSEATTLEIDMVPASGPADKAQTLFQMMPIGTL